MCDEEQSLGDFFAKKDKGKKAKKTKKVKSISEIVVESNPADTEPKQVKDEWKDFEEKKEKDYSSLKIQDLQVSEEVSKEDTESDENNDAEDIEGGIKKTKSEKGSSKWGESQSVPQPVLVSNDNTTKATREDGKYVPPSMMKRMQENQKNPRLRNGAPPDLSNQVLFPSLSAASQTSERTPNDFEVVKRGTRSNDAHVVDNRPGLDLGNRYDGLRS